jgi:hypothetical protein
MIKKSFRIIGVILVIILVATIFFFNIQKPNDEIIQKCSKQNGYCVYDNIPSFLKYQEPFWFDDDTIQPFKGNLSDYLLRDESPRRLGEVFSGDWSSYKCKSTGKSPKKIEYFYDLCEWMEDGMVGCWHERRAIVCRDIYFIEDFTSTYGPRLYGPFSFELEEIY